MKLHEVTLIDFIAKKYLIQNMKMDLFSLANQAMKIKYLPAALYFKFCFT